MKQILIMLCLALVVAGCAGRSASPVAISQPHDTRASCEQLKAEIAANNQQIQALADEHNLKLIQNAVAGVAGVVTLGLAWFALDAQGSAAAEADALTSRNRYLSTLASSRCRR